MDNFYGLGTASSYYDKRRHVNAIFMIMVDYHFYATPGFSDRLISVLKSGVSETKRTSIIANDILSRDELNFLNIVRERTGLPGGDFERIVSGLSLYDPQYKTPAGYDGEQDKRLLVDMVVAVYVMCSDYSSPSFTKITGEIGALAKGMRGITFDQTKFERLFHLTLDGVKANQYVNRLKEIEDYVIARW